MPPKRFRLTPARILAILAAALIPATAWPQCPDWASGPLEDNFNAVGANSIIWDMTSWDPDGAGPRRPLLVVAGQLTSIQGVTVGRVAAWDPATGRWDALGGGLNGIAYTVGVYDGELVAAGTFSSAGGGGASRIARFNGSTWRPLGSGLGSGLGDFVEELAVHAGELVAVGRFAVAGGQACTNVAAWNGTSWRPLGAGPTGTGNANRVRCALSYGGSLWVGGPFTQAGGQSAVGLARWDGTAWHAPGNITGQSNMQVSCLGVYNGDLVVGGGFFTIGGVAANHIARWNGTSWAGLLSGTNNWVQDVAVHGGVLYAGGGMTLAGGAPVMRVAAWNGSFWQPAAGGVDDWIEALVVSDGQMFASGYFLTNGTQDVNHLARWSGNEWLPFGGGTTNDVMAFTPFVTSLVAAGDFEQSTLSSPAHEIVRWDGVALQPFGTGMNGQVFALEAFKYPGVNGDYELIAGGEFTTAGGVAANHIARWAEDPLVGFPPPQWQPMGGGFNGPVYVIKRINGVTYAGGNFTSPTFHLARWNEDADIWENVGVGTNGPVFAIELYNGEIYVGGAFTQAGGLPTGGLARWIATGWQSIGFNAYPGSVRALEVHQGELAIGGEFTGPGGAVGIARYNGATFSNYGGGSADGTVRTLLSSGNVLYVGGDFLNSPASSRLARWNGAAWSTVDGGGLDEPVRALSTYHGELQVGGLFKTACTSQIASPSWARYLGGAAPWIAYEPSSQAVDAGANASFHAVPASGYPTAAFRWHRNGAPLFDTGPEPTVQASAIRGAATPSLILEGVGAMDVGVYRLVMSNASGADTSVAVNLDVNGLVDVPSNAPPGLSAIESVGPNPTRGEVRFGLALARGAAVRLHMHDVTGRRTRVIDLGARSGGRFSATWDGADETGRPVGAGLYFVALELDGRFTGIRRVTVLR